MGEVTPKNWMLFKRFLVRFHGQWLFSTPLRLELGWGHCTSHGLNHVLSEDTLIVTS